MGEQDKQAQIRERAHQLWEEQGRPEGRHEEHWEQARREIEAPREEAHGLRDIVTETIGLAVGVEPAQADASVAAEDGDKMKAKRAPGRKSASPKPAATPRGRKAKPT